MKKIAKKYVKKTVEKLVLLFLIISIGSCANLFEGSAVRTGDAAILFEARKKIDQYDWTGAITKILTLSTTALARRDVKALLASAYAGRCGLDFLLIADNLQNPGGSNFFVILVRAFPGATAGQVTDCVLAETTLKTISADANLRSSDENLLMAFVSVAKMAVVVSNNLDTNGDGIANDAVDPCAAISNAEAAEIVTGLANFIVSMARVGGDIGGTTAEDFADACEALAGTDPDYDICSFVDTSQVTQAEHRQVVRGMVKETDDGFGVGAGAGDTLANAAGCGG